MNRGFHGTCHHCGKKGHKKIDCYQLQNKTKKEKEDGAVVLMTESADINNVICQEIVISEEGCSEEVIIIDGDVMIDAHIKFNQPTKFSWADTCESREEESMGEHGDIPDLLSDCEDSISNDDLESTTDFSHRRTLQRGIWINHGEARF
jgi:hypothetical protein